MTNDVGAVGLDRAPHDSPGHGDFIRSLEKGLAVISAFSRDRPARTIPEIADQVGLTRSSAKRYLVTLSELGYARRVGRRFELTPRVLDLGHSYLASSPVVDLARRPLERLVDQVDEASSMAVLRGSHVVYLAIVPTNRIMTIGLGLGSRLPAAPTAMGRVLLAGLSDQQIEDRISDTRLESLTPHTITDRDQLMAAIEQARVDGFALVDQEFEIGVRSIAAPVSDPRGEVVAAVDVSCHAARVSLTRLKSEILPWLHATALEITASIHALEGEGISEQPPAL